MAVTSKNGRRGGMLGSLLLNFHSGTSFMTDPCLDLVDELLHMALMSGLIEPWTQDLDALLSGPAGPEHLAHYVTGALDESLSHVIADDHLHAGAIAFFQAAMPLPDEAFAEACRQWVAALIQTPGAWSQRGLLTTDGHDSLIRALDALHPSKSQRQALLEALPQQIAENIQLPHNWAQMISRSLDDTSSRPSRTPASPPPPPPALSPDCHLNIRLNPSIMEA